MPDPVLRRDARGCAAVPASSLIEDQRGGGRSGSSPAALGQRTSRSMSRTTPRRLSSRGVEGAYDLFIVSLGLQGHDGLRLCSQFRSLERTRQVRRSWFVAETEDRPAPPARARSRRKRLCAAPDRHQRVALRAPARSLRRKRYADSLRENVQASIEMAVVDTLTGTPQSPFLQHQFRRVCWSRPARKRSGRCR